MSSFSYYCYKNQEVYSIRVWGATLSRIAKHDRSIRHERASATERIGVKIVKVLFMQGYSEIAVNFTRLWPDDFQMNEILLFADPIHSDCEHQIIVAVQLSRLHPTLHDDGSAMERNIARNRGCITQGSLPPISWQSPEDGQWGVLQHQSWCIYEANDLRSMLCGSRRIRLNFLYKHLGSIKFLFGLFSSILVLLASHRQGFAWVMHHERQ